MKGGRFLTKAAAVSVPEPATLAGFLAVVGKNTPPITLRQFAVLLLLETAPRPLGVGEIAARTKLFKHAITRACDRLEQLGYINRAVNPGDERMRLVTLEPAGHKVLAQFRAAAAPLPPAT